MKNITTVARILERPCSCCQSWSHTTVMCPHVEPAYAMKEAHIEDIAELLKPVN